MYSDSIAADLCESSVGKIDDETELPEILISIFPLKPPIATYS